MNRTQAVLQVKTKFLNGVCRHEHWIEEGALEMLFLNGVCRHELAEKVNIVLERGKTFYEDALNKAATELCWEKEEPKILALFRKVTQKHF